MESPSTKPPFLNRPSKTNSFAIYDGVLSGPTKLRTALSPRTEDYAEIFGMTRGGSRLATSIPVLDLPPADVAGVPVLFRGRSFDYTEVFGKKGSEARDFAVFEEVFASAAAGYDSSDQAWTPTLSEPLSDESEPFACTGTCQSIPNAEFHHSSDVLKQFKVSYNKVFHQGEDDVANGVAHVTKLNDVPGYSFFVNETLPLQKMVVTNNLQHEVFGGLPGERKRLRKTTSCDNKPFVTISDISLKTRPSHLPPPSRPPPILGPKDGDSNTQSSKIKAYGSFAFGETTSAEFSPLFYDVEVDASTSAAVSAAAMKDVMEKAEAKLKSAKHRKDRNKQACERDLNGVKGSGDNATKHDKKSPSKNEGNVEWKQDEEFFEVVEIDDERNFLGVGDDQRVSVHNLRNNGDGQDVRENQAISQQREVNKKMKSDEEICEKIIVEAIEDEDFENMAEVRNKETEDEGKCKNVEREVCDTRPKEATERVKTENRLKESLERVEKDRKEREAWEREETEKREEDAREREFKEKMAREAIEKEENEKRLRLALEEKEKKQREACERKEKEKREKEACEGELEEKRLREAIEKEENEKRLRLDLEEKERKQREAREREEKEERDKEARQREEKEKRDKEAREREVEEIGLKKVLEEEEEKKQREAREREEQEEREKEARQREEKEKRVKEAHEREVKEKRLKKVLEEEEKKQREAWEREEEKKKREKEACQREENEKRVKEARAREVKEKRLKNALEEEEEKKQKEACDREEQEKRTKEARDREIAHKLLKETIEQEENEKIKKLALEKEKNEKMHKISHKGGEAEKRLKDDHSWQNIEEQPNSILRNEENKEKVKEGSELEKDTQRVREVHEREVYEKRPKEAFDHEEIDKMWEEDFRLDENIAFFGATNKVDKNSGESKKIKIPFLVEDTSLVVQVGDLNSSSVARDNLQHKKSEKIVGEGKDSLQMHDTVFEFDKNPSKRNGNIVNPKKVQVGREKKGEKFMSSKDVIGEVSAERKGKSLDKVLNREEKEKEERMKRERELENEWLRKVEEEREREREREKDRMGVDMASLERATADVRKRSVAEARERLEKVNMEAKLRAERAAVERATAEARERAFQKAKAGKASVETREGTLRSDSCQGVGSTNGPMNAYSSVHGGVEVESAERCKARQERQQRTAQRAAKALEEKNMRDLLAQRELAERNRLAEGLDAEVKRWSSGKEGNLRALLSTLQYILGPDSGWHPLHLTEVITSEAVKRAYRKATLWVHPDKLQQRGASIHEKYICEKVFDLLKAAWNKFNSEEP